jgi:multiple sugar transport system substrate-binding protein
VNRKLAILVVVLLTFALGIQMVTAQDPVTVTVMTWEGADTNAAIDAALATFMEANPSIVVERLPSPNSGYGERLSAMQLAGELPDVFWSGNDQMFQYADQGALYNWTEIATADDTFDLGDFAPGAIANWTAGDGGLYGLPTLMNTYGVWYNADLFTAAGLDVPAPGWTWDAFFTAAETLADPAAGMFAAQGYELVNPNEGIFTADVCAQNAGSAAPFADRIINPTTITVTPELVSCVSRLAALVQSGAITPSGYPGDGQTELFIAGQIPMLVFGQWLAPSFMNAAPAFTYGFAPLPVADGVEPADAIQLYDAVGIASPADIENPEAVWEVAKFLASAAWESILLSAPVAPPAHIPSAQPYFDTLSAAGLESAAASIQYMLEAPTKLPIRFTAPWASQANDVLGANWGNILNGTTGVEEGLNAIAEQVNGIITSASS